MISFIVLLQFMMLKGREVTIYDLADKLNISIATVSRALKDDPVVSKRTKKKIIDLAEKLGADLIVISTHGNTGIKHVLMGSTAERVVRHARCPVLVVRA